MAARDYILDNFWWKLLSLLLAALTWLTIETTFQKDNVTQKSSVITSSRVSFPIVPITLLTSVSNTNRFKINPSTVAIEVSGTETELTKLRPQEIQAFVDLTDAGDDKQFRKPVQVQIPKTYTLMSVTPPNTRVERVTSPP